MTLEELEQLKRPEIYKQIEIYKNFDSKLLALKLTKTDMLPTRAIAEQVYCYNKAKKKLPTLFDKKLLFDKVALEQCSNEPAAKYKSTLISGARLIDLTGGLGVDDLFFTTSFETITYCELNKVLSEIFKYNISKLEISNVTVKNSDSIKLLSAQKNNYFDWIYVDPSRRDGDKRSVDLTYCAPNVYEQMNLFFQKSENVMLKAAPAYDITEAIRRFDENLLEIHVISVDGECKEVLLILKRRNFKQTPKITSVTLNSKNDSKFIFTFDFSIKADKRISEIKNYLHIPDCSIVKSNLTPNIAKKLGLTFINSDTHFLTSCKIIDNLPGRSFKIKKTMKFNDKEIKKFLKINGIKKANISAKGFKMSVDEVKKRFKLNDGGNVYLFFTSDLNNQSIMLVCEKDF